MLTAIKVRPGGMLPGLPAAGVASSEVNAAVFFLDPLAAQTYGPDIQALMRACDAQGVLPATNLATLDPMVAGPAIF